MALIKWSDDLSVKVAVIDQQHQKLIDLINSLDDAMRQGKGKDVLGKILVELIAYAGTHFGTEERYFSQYGYPETDVHKKEHVGFTAKVGQFKADFDSGKVMISIQVMNFLSDWLRNHIKVVDKKYGPFFNEKGLN